VSTPTEECRSCHHPIDWAVNVEGLKPNPVNHDSAGDPKGNLEVWRSGDGLLRYRYLKKGEEPAPGRRRGISHFATCPNRDQWRSRSKGAANAGTA
jgi:hypothetical protein